ncbi:hypothetical protein [Urbifossiella limnaea]|uniref:Uncharacterized protein n=1 Tax=Urbifossiella limnaea TaxID=2528023 RepID=A0A517Y0K9_9BACT|nr:hypothetical protein [Urbifossiella limnaea]QDU23296.1 hypothetical protein ETAA1_52910 [Urbifossiella limnaea]
MVKRLPLLAVAVEVELPERRLAGRAQRLNSVGYHMSSYEVVAQAIGVLEGEVVAGPLLDFYRRATDRMLMIRGKLRLDDVYEGSTRTLPAQQWPNKSPSNGAKSCPAVPSSA